jgi:hypothetical protein
VIYITAWSATLGGDVDRGKVNMVSKIVWNITTSGERSIHDIAKELADAGLHDSQILEEIGIITGDAEEAVVAKFRQVRGVVDVSPSAPVDVGPPGSPVTW